MDRKKKILENIQLIEGFNGEVKLLVASVPDNQLIEVLEECKKESGIILKLFPEDVNRLLEKGISLSSKDYEGEYSCNTIGQAPIELLELLAIKRVLVGALENNNVQMMDKQEYKSIYQKLKLIVADIPRDMDERRKFRKIYTRLANLLTYDYAAVKNRLSGIDEKFEDSAKEEDIDSCRNLKNAVTLGKCVCVGFAETLKQTLSLVGIESIICKSKANEEGTSHAYNQVKINGIWYNADLTWDYEDIRKKIRPKYCLKSDRDFVPLKEESRAFHIPKERKKAYLCSKSLEIYKTYIKYFSFQEGWNALKTRIQKRNKNLLSSSSRMAEPEKSELLTIDKFRKRYLVEIKSALLEEELQKGVRKKENELEK